MWKRFLMIFVSAILSLLVTSAVVFADQDGTSRYCNKDQYGCWITEEDGRRCYIMFWSEESRKYFMGDKPAVVCPPPEGNAPTMELEAAPLKNKKQDVKPIRPVDPVQPEEEIEELQLENG